MNIGIKGGSRSIHKHPQNKINTFAHVDESTNFSALKEFHCIFLRLASSPK